MECYYSLVLLVSSRLLLFSFAFLLFFFITTQHKIRAFFDLFCSFIPNRRTSELELTLSSYREGEKLDFAMPHNQPLRIHLRTTTADGVSFTRENKKARVINNKPLRRRNSFALSLSLSGLKMCEKWKNGRKIIARGKTKAITNAHSYIAGSFSAEGAHLNASGARQWRHKFPSRLLSSWLRCETFKRFQMAKTSLSEQ